MQKVNLLWANKEDSVGFNFVFLKIDDMCPFTFVDPVNCIKEVAVRKRYFYMLVVCDLTFYFEVFFFYKRMSNLQTSRFIHIVIFV